MVNYWVWMRCQSYRIALRGFSRKHLRCDRRTSVGECLIKKLWRTWGIVFLGWSDYLCLYVCICVHTVYNYFEHPKENGTKAVSRFFQNYFVFCQSESVLHESWKICSISWVNLHLADLALCQLIWTERGLPRQRMLLILFSFIWTDLLWLRAPCLIILFWRGTGHCLLPKYLND